MYINLTKKQVIGLKKRYGMEFIREPMIDDHMSVLSKFSNRPLKYLESLSELERPSGNCMFLKDTFIGFGYTLAFPKEWEESVWAECDYKED